MGEAEAQEGPHVDTSKKVGDRDHLKVFANADAAEAWFAENDPEGVAFEYEVLRPLAPVPTIASVEAGQLQVVGTGAAGLSS